MFSQCVIAFLLWSDDPRPQSPPMTLMESQLELARGDKVYLELGGGQIGVYLRGMQVKSLALESQAGFLGPAATVSRVDRLIPGLPQKVVVACPGCEDPSGGTGLDDRIGIEEMPANFLAVLDDGTSWLVLSESGWKPGSQIKSAYWQGKGLIRFLESLVVQGQGQYLFSRMKPESARALYWAIQPGTAVLRAEALSERGLLEEIQMNSEQVLVVLLMAISLICIWVLHRKGMPPRRRRRKWGH